MKVTVIKEFTFDSAHHLPNHPGKCKNPHGHTYKLQVGFRGVPDEATGMVIDFGDIESTVITLLSDLDHKDLNQVDLINFPKQTPTAENMVIWLARYLETLFFQNPKYDKVEVSLIRLWETPTSYAEWRRGWDEWIPMYSFLREGGVNA